MSEYVVELKNATKRFPGVVALKNMQLSVKPGEILGLIGENGAGKSTLIKVLTGVHQADEGQIFVDGVEQHFKARTIRQRLASRAYIRSLTLRSC